MWNHVKERKQKLIIDDNKYEEIKITIDGRFSGLLEFKLNLPFSEGEFCWSAVYIEVRNPTYMKIKERLSEISSVIRDFCICKDVGSEISLKISEWFWGRFELRSKVVYTRRIARIYEYKQNKENLCVCR